MNPRPPQPLASTSSAAWLQTEDYAAWTAGTDRSIRAAIRDLVVGDAESEARVADVVFLRFQSHLVAIARFKLRKCSGSSQSCMPSASDLAQEVFSDSPIRKRLIANLANLRRDHGDDFPLHKLVRYVTESAEYGFRDLLKQKSNRIPKPEERSRFLAELEANREADERKRQWELVEKYLASRLQEDELEVALLNFQDGQSVREISEFMRTERPTSRFAGQDRKIRTLLEEVKKCLQAWATDGDHDL